MGSPRTGGAAHSPPSLAGHPRLFPIRVFGSAWGSIFGCWTGAEPDNGPRSHFPVARPPGGLTRSPGRSAATPHGRWAPPNVPNPHRRPTAPSPKCGSAEWVGCQKSNCQGPRLGEPRPWLKSEPDPSSSEGARRFPDFDAFRPKQCSPECTASDAFMHLCQTSDMQCTL